MRSGHQVDTNSALRKQAHLALVENQHESMVSLLSKFGNAHNPDINAFISTIPEKLSSAAKILLQRNEIIDDLKLENRVKLKKFIQKFHSQSQTGTSGMGEHIAMLDDKNTKIIVSIHQPNLFAYSGVFKKIVMAETLKRIIQESDRSKKIVTLFIIVDHDFINEFWVRSAELPSSLHPSGKFQLRLPVSKSSRWQMICNVPTPSRLVLEEWNQRIRTWIKRSSSTPDVRQLESNFELFWNEVELAYQKSKSYSDLNSFLISQLVNNVIGYPTLFVRLSEISSVFEKGFMHLINNFKTYSRTLRETETTLKSCGIHSGVSPNSYTSAPIWLHCKCGSKANMKLLSDHKLSMTGTCLGCKNHLEHTFSEGGNSELDLSNIIDTISPRAIPIQLLSARELGTTCYVSGIGGLGYLVDASVISRRLLINLPLVVIWPSKDIYAGVAQTQALRLTHSNDQGLETSLEEFSAADAEYKHRIRILIEKRSELFRANRPIQHLLDDILLLKEKQREIHKILKSMNRATKALNLSPCIVDLAVNYGIVQSQKQWERHLHKVDDLAAPVFMGMK